MFRAERHEEGFYRHLRERDYRVALGGKLVRAYAWITTHATFESQGVEAEHLAETMKALELAARIARNRANASSHPPARATAASPTCCAISSSMRRWNATRPRTGDSRRRECDASLSTPDRAPLDQAYSPAGFAAARASAEATAVRASITVITCSQGISLRSITPCASGRTLNA